MTSRKRTWKKNYFLINDNNLPGGASFQDPSKYCHVTHNCFGPPFLFVEGLLSTGPTPSSFYLLVEMGLPLHLFPAYILWKLDQLFVKRHHHKDLKWTKLFLGPIQTCLEAFLGFLSKNKMKAYTKLTVVMCCQIVDRKSVAPSSGDFRRRPAPRYACGQDQECWRKKVLVNKLLHRFRGRGRTSAGGGVPHRIF